MTYICASTSATINCLLHKILSMDLSTRGFVNLLPNDAVSMLD